MTAACEAGFACLAALLYIRRFVPPTDKKSTHTPSAGRLLLPKKANNWVL